MDAILNLPPNKSKRVITLDLIAIRVNNQGSIRNSKPCSMCIKYMQRIRYGYRIRYIYYSDAKGAIIKTSLKTVVETNDHQFSSAFLRSKDVKKKGFIVKKKKKSNKKNNN